MKLTYKHIQWRLDILLLKGHFRSNLLALKGQRKLSEPYCGRCKTWSLKGKGKQMLSKQVLDWFWLQGSSVRVNIEVEIGQVLPETL